MKNIIVGTAGHIDHGKTTLIRALTGRNTDRWEEEQRRGITIDLGFTWFDLPSGNRVGIIDVPGPEKFVNNMVAGVVGMDLVLLVIAADEGVMPQTVEPLDILSLLGVQGGLVVLTKAELVDDDWLELVRGQALELTEGTCLEGAPILSVSAVTGQGIPELRDALYRLVQEAREKSALAPFRLPIDRVFSVDGFGTVVTGTLTEGAVQVGDAVELVPSGLQSRVRTLQVHGESVDAAYAGQRAALNLTNLQKSEIRRGDAAVRPGSARSSRMLDVRLRCLRNAKRTVLNGSQVHLYHGTSVHLAKAVLLERDELRPGESCLAQLRLTEPMAVKQGDRFVIRFYSPVETIGGGTVLDPRPLRHKRHDLAVLDTLWDRCRELLSAYHQKHPLHAGMPAAELRQKLFRQITPAEGDALLEVFRAEGRMKRAENRWALAEFSIRLTKRQTALWDALLERFLRGGPEPDTIEAVLDSIPPERREEARQVLESLLTGGELVRLSPELCWHREVFQKGLDILRTLCADHGAVTLAEVRDAFDTTRKYALLFLEACDRRQITVREGDCRRLKLKFHD